MRSGTLRHKILIEQSTEVRDARGETTQTWIVYKQVHAAIHPQNGTETTELHQENNTITHKIIIRYQSGITAKMRVHYNARIFDIESVINVGERNKSLALMCVERL